MCPVSTEMGSQPCRGTQANCIFVQLSGGQETSEVPVRVAQGSRGSGSLFRHEAEQGPGDTRDSGEGAGHQPGRGEGRAAADNRVASG